MNFHFGSFQAKIFEKHKKTLILGRFSQKLGNLFPRDWPRHFLAIMVTWMHAKKTKKASSAVFREKLITNILPSDRRTIMKSQDLSLSRGPKTSICRTSIFGPWLNINESLYCRKNQQHMVKVGNQNNTYFYIYTISLFNFKTLLPPNIYKSL